jgi:hypothetical protein
MSTRSKVATGLDGNPVSADHFMRLHTPEHTPYVRHAMTRWHQKPHDLMTLERELSETLLQRSIRRALPPVRR